MSDENILKEAKELAQRLAALPELSMRRRALLDFLRQSNPQHAVAILAHIHEQGRNGGPPYDVSLLALANLLDGHLCYDLLAELYQSAKDNGFDALSQLFFSAPKPPTYIDKKDENQRILTLGHRKTLARSQDRNIIEKLLADPEPPVINHLLQNPRLTERDVVLLTAKRPINPDILRTISRSRWITRYAVKRALVLNPNTPIDISLRLLSFFTLKDRKLISTSQSLDPKLRDAAKKQ